MTIPGSANPLLLASQTQYTVSRSLRFNAPDGSFLSRTPASAGNRKTWTYSCWVKKLQIASTNGVLLASSSATFNNSNSLALSFINNDRIYFYAYSTGYFITEQVFRDPSSWYHIVLAFDSTQSAAIDRAKLYVNGSLVTQFNYENRSAITQNADFGVNAAHEHRIGSRHFDVSVLSDFYLANVEFVDGQQLTPSSFAETNATTGQWVPRQFSGSYGSQGWKLTFSDNSNTTATTLGKDSSGLGNNWSCTNFSVAAGAGNDSLVDTPTSYGTDDSLGGSVRGNYCTLNPVDSTGGLTLSNGNLDLTSTQNDKQVLGTIAIPSSGKWYFEATQGATSGQFYRMYVGAKSVLGGTGGFLVACFGNGTSVFDSAGNTYTWSVVFDQNDVLGVAINADNGTVTVYKNNVAFSTTINYTSTSTLRPSFGTGNSGVSCVANFGQRPFAYTAPSGFKALCDTNLPAPAVIKPSTAFDVLLYTGNGATPRALTGLNFSPDLVWTKNRSSSQAWNVLFDAVRGVGNQLASNQTDAELATGSNLAGKVGSFDSSGFTLVAGSGGSPYLSVNETNSAYVAWCWDAGSSNTTNTSGTITSTTRVNATAGFSIVTYTGIGSTGTVGHGLGVKPSMVIVKTRNVAGTNDWFVYHSSNFGADPAWQRSLLLNSTSVGGTANLYPWGADHSSTVISVSGNTATWSTNTNGNTYVAYCFAPVVGYSSGFSYTGNGSTDGVFQFLGFRPKLILLKRTDTTGNWTLIDTAREGYNVDNDPLYPNLSDAEGTADLLDITSNGFKLRSTDASVNANAGTYVGFAWAEMPFAYSRAR